MDKNEHICLPSWKLWVGDRTADMSVDSEFVAWAMWGLSQALVRYGKEETHAFLNAKDSLEGLEHIAYCWSDRYNLSDYNYEYVGGMLDELMEK